MADEKPEEKKDPFEEMKKHDTAFVSKTTENEVVLGKGISSEQFLRCMTYFSFGINEWRGTGKKYLRDKKAYEKTDPIDPPLTFPINCWIEGSIPEPIYFTPYDNWVNTWGWKVIVIREGFAVSETSHLFGSYASQKEAVRRNLRELMGTLYTIRHSVLNMMSDQERLSEQVAAFKAGSVEQIKGIFVDNYGGQGRTFTELARNVPMIKSALSWFYKVNSLEDVEKNVEEGKLNPVVANYLKRKIQEFEEWKNKYQEWLFTAHDNLVDLINEQRSNEKLYESWAKDSVKQAKRLELDWEMVKESVDSFEFPRFASKAGYAVELFFYKNNDQVKQLMAPWHPCCLINIGIFYNPDLQGWKFTRSSHSHYYGAIHKDDLAKLSGWVDMDIKAEELSKMMALRAGMSAEEVSAMEAQRTLKKAKEKEEKKGEKGAPDAETVVAEKYWDVNEQAASLTRTLGDMFLLPFGVDVHKRANTRRMRAEADAHYWFHTYYKTLKNTYGIPHYE